MVKPQPYRDLSFYVFCLASVAIMSACAQKPTNPMIGIWEVVETRAMFDERRVNPGTFNQVMAYLKSTQLNLSADSVAIFQRPDKIDTLRWELEVGSAALLLYRKQSEPRRLIFNGKNLHLNEITPIGQVVLVFSLVNP